MPATSRPRPLAASTNSKSTGSRCAPGWNTYTPNLRSQVPVWLAARNPSRIAQSRETSFRPRALPRASGGLTKHAGGGSACNPRASSIRAAADRDKLLPQVQGHCSADRGSALFAQQCRVCHQLGQRGAAGAGIWPASWINPRPHAHRDLDEPGGRGPLQNYVAETKSETSTGMLINKNPETVSPSPASPSPQTILRSGPSRSLAQKSPCRGFEQFPRQDLATIAHRSVGLPQ